MGTSNDQNQFGWDLGGGLMVFFGEHVGVRGEVRYFQTFQAFSISSTGRTHRQPQRKELEFGRAPGCGFVLEQADRAKGELVSF